MYKQIYIYLILCVFSVKSSIDQNKKLLSITSLPQTLQNIIIDYSWQKEKKIKLYSGRKIIVSPDKTIFAVISSRFFIPYVTIFDDSFNEIHRITGRTNEYDQFASSFSPNNKYIALAFGTRLEYWNLKTKDLEKIDSTEHKKEIKDLQFSLDGKYLASTSADKKINIFNAEALTLIHSQDNKEKLHCYSANISYKSSQIIIAAIYSSFDNWHKENGNPFVLINYFKPDDKSLIDSKIIDAHNMNNIIIAPDQNYLLLTRDYVKIIYNMLTKTYCESTQMHTHSSVRSLFQPVIIESKYICSAQADSVNLVDCKSKHELTNTHRLFDESDESEELFSLSPLIIDIGFIKNNNGTILLILLPEFLGILKNPVLNLNDENDK